MIAKSVPAPCRSCLPLPLASACLVTEDAGARARKSTNSGQLPDIWKLPADLYQEQLRATPSCRVAGRGDGSLTLSLVHRPRYQPPVSAAVLPGGQAGPVALGVGEHPEARCFLVADQRAAGGERRLNARPDLRG